MDRHSWDERYRDKELLWTAEPNRFLVEAVDGLEPGRALDLAAGEGRNSVWLARGGWQVEAVDFSDVAIDKARGLAGHFEVEGIGFAVEDLLAWAPSERAYDLVALVYFQIPSPEREGVWRKAAAAVRLGGRLVVIGHDSDNLEKGYGGPQQADVLYSAQEVAGVVAEQLDVIRAEQVIRPVETDDGVREAIDYIVVAVATSD